MATEKVKSYSPELVDEMVRLYDGGNGLSAREIAAKINRPYRSVVGKLVSLQVYVPADKPVKGYEDTGPTKKALIESLKGFNFSEAGITGLENATKPALQEILEKLSAAKAAVTAEVEELSEVA